MADHESDDACCSSLYPADELEDIDIPDLEDIDIAAGDFPIDNWNAEAEGNDEEPRNLDVGVFVRDVNPPEEDIAYMDDAVFLELPKFSKGFKESDFREFVRKYVGEENVIRLANWNQPNLWLMQVKTQEIRENLLRLWKTKIKNKTCCINPYYSYELRGFIHWLPNFISNEEVRSQLSLFGDVVLLENVVHDHWNGKVQSEVRYFGLRLKDGMVKNDMPHFLKFGDYRALVVVRGRKPACFHCKEFGHNKAVCEKYKEKLAEYCKNPEARKPRIKPRGRRHRPDVKSESQNNNKQEDYTKSTQNVESAQKQISPGQKSKDTEIKAILQSMKDWEEKTKEMVEQNLAEIEKKLWTNSAVTEVKEKCPDLLIETLVKESFEEMKRSTIKMIDETSIDLKKVVAEHFGLDSNKPLESPIRDLEISKNKVSKQVKLFEQLLSYT